MLDKIMDVIPEFEYQSYVGILITFFVCPNIGSYV